MSLSIPQKISGASQQKKNSVAEFSWTNEADGDLFKESRKPLNAACLAYSKSPAAQRPHIVLKGQHLDTHIFTIAAKLKC